MSDIEREMADTLENQNQKRSFTEQSDILSDVKGILLDIEGTTTPISFIRVIISNFVVVEM